MTPAPLPAAPVPADPKTLCAAEVPMTLAAPAHGCRACDPGHPGHGGGACHFGAQAAMPAKMATLAATKALATLEAQAVTTRAPDDKRQWRVESAHSQI